MRSGELLRASLDFLKPEEQHRYAELAIFRAGEVIPITTVATLWQLDDIDSEDLTRKLDDLALVEFDLRRATLRLHDVLRVFMAGQLSDASAVHGKADRCLGQSLQLTRCPCVAQLCGSSSARRPRNCVSIVVTLSKLVNCQLWGN